MTSWSCSQKRGVLLAFPIPSFLYSGEKIEQPHGIPAQKWLMNAVNKLVSGVCGAARQSLNF